MTQPVVSRRSWQLADLSRTADDTVLAIEYSRLHLKAAPSKSDRRQLQRDMTQIVTAVLQLLALGEGETTARLSFDRDVVVPRSIADGLRQKIHDEGSLRTRLEMLVRVLPNADSLNGDMLDMLDMLAEVADAEATTSMRPLMRK
jgi:hypothetical protein